MSQGSLKIDYIRVSGFRGFPEEKEIKFEKPAVLLFGPNGSGKSSILNAIEWCLFGEESAKKGEGATEIVERRKGWKVQNLESKDTKVEISFSDFDGEKIIVQRTLTLEKKGKKTVEDFSIYLQEQPEPIKEESKIKEIFKTWWGDYLASVHLHQEIIRNLVVVSPGDRKTMIYSLLGLSDLKNLSVTLGGEINKAKKLPQKLEDDFNRFETRVGDRLKDWEDGKNKIIEEGKTQGAEKEDFSEEKVARLCRDAESLVQRLFRDYGLEPIDLGGFDNRHARKTYMKNLDKAYKKISMENPTEKELNRILGLKAELSVKLREYDDHKNYLSEANRENDELVKKAGNKGNLEKDLPIIRQRLSETKKQREIQNKLAGLVDEAIKFFKTTETKVANCPVCGHAEAREHFRKGELRLARCGRCGMIHANPAPAEFASGKYYDQAGADYYLSPAKLESDYAAVRFERELRLFRSHCLRGAVLDVGCSSGAFLFQLNQRFPGCYNILGTDVSGAPLDYAESRGVPVLCGDFPGQNFGGKQFAAVTCWAVIEHLLEPRQFLDKAWSILEPNGLCFVLVPNMRSLAARLLGARYRYVYPQHLNYFTKATLTQLVETRFSVIDFRSTHFNPLVIWQDWRGGGKEVANRERADLLKRTTAYKDNPRLRPVKVLYKIVERTLGRLTLADNLAVVLRAKTVTRKSYGNAED